MPQIVLFNGRDSGCTCSGRELARLGFPPGSFRHAKGCPERGRDRSRGVGVVIGVVDNGKVIVKV